MRGLRRRLIQACELLAPALSSTHPDSATDRLRRALLAALWRRCRTGGPDPIPELGPPPPAAEAAAELLAEDLRRTPAADLLPRIFEQLCGLRCAAGRLRTDAGRKRHGRFYTSRALASFVVALALGDLPRTATVLDPAVGGGAFLVAAARHLVGDGAQQAARRAVVTRLAGVDLDPLACTVAALALQAWVGSDDVYAALRNRLLAGDALQLPEARLRALAPRGFDAVCTNPPYLGEQFHRALFAPLRVRFPEVSGPRMDYWYFFAALALRVVADGGRVAFVTPSYWLRAHGARRLRATLARTGRLHRLVHFGTTPLFPDARGQHNTVWVFAKEPRDAPGQRLDVHPGEAAEALFSTLLEAPREASTPTAIAGRDPATWGGSRADGRRLETLLEPRQGIVPNPDRLSRRQAERLGCRPGQGVFLLTGAELDELGLSPAERTLLVPAYRNSDIRPFAIDYPDLWLLYLTSGDSLEGRPAIARHLARFRPLLAARREVRSGRIPWFSLHWPRERARFERPRLVLSNWGNGPRALALEPGYGFERRDITALLPRGPEVPLEALLALCNAPAYRARLGAAALGYCRQAELRAWPLPPPGRADWERRLTATARLLRASAERAPLAPDDPLWARLDAEVEEAFG